MEKEFYSVSEIAVLFGMSAETVRRLIASQEIPAKRVGLKWYVPKSYVDKRDNE